MSIDDNMFLDPDWKRYSPNHLKKTNKLTMGFWNVAVVNTNNLLMTLDLPLWEYNYIAKP
jgi:hypothetical protein